MFMVPLRFFLGSPSLVVLLTCLLLTGVLAFAALLVGFFTKWVNSLFSLAGLTIVTIVFDQLAGNPLTLTGYLNYQVVDAVRFYGLGNEGAALLFGSWFVVSGLLVNRFGSWFLIPHFKRWGFLAISALLLLIASLPQFGASFGVLGWGIVGILFVWWLINERRVTPIFVVVVFVAALGTVLGALTLDLTFNVNSHQQWLLSLWQNGLLTFITTVFDTIFKTSLPTILYSPWLTILFILVMLSLFVLILVRPGSYGPFWQRNSAFRAVFISSTIILPLMCLTEDSGIFMPALYLIFLLAGFIWLVCDLHTWRAREILFTGTPISLRELQQSGGVLGLANQQPKKPPASNTKDRLAAP
jgi:hypothetical protein